MSSLIQPVFPPLILALQNPAVYPHPVGTIRIIETHISWVILTGTFAYKIKKPVHFNFIDYSTLDKRQHYCEAEFELNQVCAAPLYKAVVPLYGSETSPSFTSDEASPIEYAIQLYEFPQEALLSSLLPTLDTDKQTQLMHQMAEYLADFHQRCPVVPDDWHYGSPSHDLFQFVQDNIKDVRRLNTDPKIQQLASRIALLTKRSLIPLHIMFAYRKLYGFVRQCHGDLHLGNMVMLNDTVYCFDRIEFNPELQWIDVMSDLAFLLMDLEFHGFKTLSYILINTYMHHSHDYDGLSVLTFYKAYRAMVRAKVALLTTPPKRTEARAYIDYTTRLLNNKTPPRLVLTHGFSGSGKSHLSEALASQLHCVLLQSDVYRQDAHFRLPEVGMGTDMYTANRINAVYEGLLDITQHLLEQGQSVWVDATFLKQTHRHKFISLAKKNKAPWVILDIQAPYTLLAKRITERPQSDVTLSILDAQIAAHDPLTPNENKYTVTLTTDTHTPTSYDSLITRLTEVLSR